MFKALDKLYIRAAYGLNNLTEKVLYNEDGDTNFISIIIVLGIVLALVVVFRGFITSILDKIKTNVSSFTNDKF